ncbi:MAG: transposase [Mycobacterium sp.]
MADRAYTSGVTRRRCGAARSSPSSRRTRRQPGPPAFNETLYKKRNLVERSFALLKQWRALATRYDKLAITYRAAVVLSACITWARHLGDML